MRSGLVYSVNLADLSDHPSQVSGEILIVEALEQQHFENVVVGTGRLDVLPSAVAAKGPRVELFQREVGL